MTPLFGRKKEPKEDFDETMKKVDKSWDSHEYQKALKYIEQAQEIANTAKLDQQDLIWLWSTKGSVLWRLDRLDEALECYDRAISINPRRAFAAWNNKSLVLLPMKKWNEIVENCNKMLELIPEFRAEIPKEKMISRVPSKAMTWEQIESEVLALKGDALIHLTKIKEAISCCDKAFEVDPNNFKAWMYKAHAYGILREFKEMKECIKKGYLIHEMNPFPDPMGFLDLLATIADDWKAKEIPIKLLGAQCLTCKNQHAILQYPENDEKSTILHLPPPFCKLRPENRMVGERKNGKPGLYVYEEKDAAKFNLFVKA